LRSPQRDGLGKLMGQRGQDPADALAGLDEVIAPDDALVQQTKEPGVNVGTDGLHDIQRKGVAGSQVDVEDTQPRIEPIARQARRASASRRAYR